MGGRKRRRRRRKGEVPGSVDNPDVAAETNKCLTQSIPLALAPPSWFQLLPRVE